MQQVLWPLTTENEKKLNIDHAVFGHISWILHKLCAATMDGKGREGTYNFSHDDWGQPGAGHRAQVAAATPLAPPMPPPV